MMHTGYLKPSPAAARACDAVISNRGHVGRRRRSSRGERSADWVRSISGKSRSSPGRPIAFGQINGDAIYRACRGNPAAMMVTFLRMARPALLKTGGGQRPAAPDSIQSEPASRIERSETGANNVRVHLEDGEDGFPVARKHPRSGAGILSSLVEADGVELNCPRR